MASTPGITYKEITHPPTQRIRRMQAPHGLAQQNRANYLQSSLHVGNNGERKLASSRVAALQNRSDGLVTSRPTERARKGRTMANSPARPTKRAPVYIYVYLSVYVYLYIVSRFAPPARIVGSTVRESAAHPGRPGGRRALCVCVCSLRGRVRRGSLPGYPPSRRVVARTPEREQALT